MYAVVYRNSVIKFLTCPVFRNLEAMAPGMAWSSLAVGKTMKGALPPSSKDSFLMVGPHLEYSHCGHRYIYH